MANKTKLTPAITKKICALVEEGSYFYSAAQANGISYTTFRNWMQLGEQGKEPYVSFLDAVRAAEATAEVRLVKLWSKAAADSWQAARDLLERRHRERWGKSEAIELSGPGKGPVQFDMSRLSDADISTIVAIYERAAATGESEDGAGQETVQ